MSSLTVGARRANDLKRWLNKEMTKPEYKRPFKKKDFRGHFKWSDNLTKCLNGHLYHACHKKDLVKILKKRKLVLRSHWFLKLPSHGRCKVPGVWTGLNYYNNGNYYGPYLLKIPINILNGKSFMAFKRKDDRERFFFVQYEAKIPIYSRKGNSWKEVDFSKFFSGTSNNFYKKSSAIYDIILTDELKLKDIQVKAVDHPKCISKKCSGMGQKAAKKKLKKIVKTNQIFK